MKEQSIQTIQIMYHAMIQNDLLSLQKAIETSDVDDIADEVIAEYQSGQVENPDMLSKLVAVMHYIENETEFSAPMSDEKYDILVEFYQDSTDSVVSGTFHEVPSKDDGTSYHRYPELRGTLGKIHFLYNDEIPEHDSRKSFEWYWNRLMNTNLKENLNLFVTMSAKYDGHSVVFEMNKMKVEKALTRYKTDENLGKDITHILGDAKLFDLCQLPPEFKKINTYGVKTEVYMTKQSLERFKKDMGNDTYNQRSAVASILNRAKGSSLTNGLDYLTIQPFQIASSVKVDVKGNDWLYIGKVGGYFYQYISVLGIQRWIEMNDLNLFIDTLKQAIDFARMEDEIPVDGVVISILDQDVIDKMGRKNDVNQFQIAYKLPTGVGRTKLKKVTFPVGPCAGTVTPLAEVEPIEINGRIIKSASLSNMEKLERLDLRLGDEVIIKYDIIPKLSKDETCKKGKGPKVVIPNACPVCGGELSETYRCTNPECASKIPGRIYNFVTKLGIPNIGLKTVERLCEEGIWTGIQSLYEINLQRKDITNLKGFGETSFNNILHGIYSRMELYPHEIVAALGIPDMAGKTMKKVFSKVDILKVTNPTLSYDEKFAMLTDVKGIGKKKAEKLLEGFQENEELITFLLTKLTIKPYVEEVELPDPETNVVFTNIRDKDFEEFLKKHGIGVSDTVSGKTSAVITSRYLRYKRGEQRVRKEIEDELFRQSYGFERKTKKIQTAEEKGIPIIDLEEYKKKMGYGKESDETD